MFFFITTIKYIALTTNSSTNISPSSEIQRNNIDRPKQKWRDNNVNKQKIRARRNRGMRKIKLVDTARGNRGMSAQRVKRDVFIY